MRTPRPALADLSFLAARFGLETGCLRTTLDELEWQTRKERIDI